MVFCLLAKMRLEVDVDVYVDGEVEGFADVNDFLAALGSADHSYSVIKGFDNRIIQRLGWT